MSLLIVTHRHRVAMEHHAAAAYPEECCGVLIGRPLREQGKVLIEQVLPARNEREEARESRFVIAPEVVLAATRQARSAGLEVVGYYHSHPDHPAEPSDFDREHAWPGLSYVIVAVKDGEPGEVRSWRLTDDRSRFEEETLEEPRAAAPSVRSPGRSAGG